MGHFRISTRRLVLKIEVENIMAGHTLRAPNHPPVTQMISQVSLGLCVEERVAANAPVMTVTNIFPCAICTGDRDRN